MHRHGRLLKATREKIGGKNLVRRTASRYSTTFLTLKRQEKCNIVLSTNFWDVVKDCVSALEPLLIQLRLVNSDDMPALPGVYAGMDLAKKKINDSFANKPLILRRVMDIKLDEAALFLDPRKFYDIRKNDSAYACRQRIMFNDVLGQMVVGDADLVARIDKWWTSFGGIAIEVQRFAKRIVGLCCSAAPGHERNWSTFEYVSN
uniref:HAT C-terminal dimerisation domain-containing protein n=1 Tax=Setaria italica TaxID=4555 RepID=K4ALC9_SETIT